MVRGAGLAFLGLTGMFALRDAGGFVAKYTEDVFEGLSQRARWVMWACFFLGIVFLAAPRLLSGGAPRILLEGTR